MTHETTVEISPEEAGLTEDELSLGFAMACLSNHMLQPTRTVVVGYPSTPVGNRTLAFYHDHWDGHERSVNVYIPHIRRMSLSEYQDHLDHLDVQCSVMAWPVKSMTAGKW